LYSRKKRNKTEIEPLKQFPDFSKQIKTGSFHQAVNLDRIYFVDENYQRLIVSSEEIRSGGELTRYTGQLPFIPEKGDILSNEDFTRKFEVVRRHIIPYLSYSIIPKIYIVLKEIK
jgi:hypothetical protein